MAASDSLEFRSLRRSDFASYRPVVLLGLGKLETSTGLETNAEATIDQLSRRSIWFILGLLRLFGRPIFDTLVAVDGHDVVGTGTVLWLPAAGYVAGMATKPEFRGRGIASRILALLDALARRRHRAWLALDVESGNEPAIRVYRKAGYRDAGAFTWYTRTGLPPGGSPVPPASRIVGRQDWDELTARLDASRPADYRGALPARARVLGHNEIMVRGGRTENRTWRSETAEGTLCVLRAYFVPGLRMGAYFPTTTLPEPPAEALSGLFDAATDWLRPREPVRCLAVAPEPHGGIASALERRGFSGVVSSTVMVRPTSPGPA